MTKKPVVSSVSVLLASSRRTLINNNINIDDQGAVVPSVQIFANQFKRKNPKKFSIFVLKVVTSGPYLIFMTSNHLLTLLQLPIYLASFYATKKFWKK